MSENKVCVSLAIQEVHNGLKHIVSVLCEAAISISRDVRTLYLAQDVTHLFHTLLDVRLETTHKHTQNTQSHTYTLYKVVGIHDN